MLRYILTGAHVDKLLVQTRPNNYKDTKQRYWKFDILMLIFSNSSLLVNNQLQLMTPWQPNVLHITGLLWRESINHQKYLSLRANYWSFEFPLLLAWTYCWSNSWVVGEIRWLNAPVMSHWWILTKSRCFIPYDACTHRIHCHDHLCLSTHWGQDNMATIFQTTFSNGFYWMEICEFWLKFH